MSKFLNFLKNAFQYTPEVPYNFTLENSNEKTETQDSTNQPTKINTELDKNLEFLKYTYNSLICNDVIIREFTLCSNNISYNAFAIYLDGMVDGISINEFVLSPLMMKNRANTFNKKQKKYVSEKKVDDVKIKKFKLQQEKDLVNNISNFLLPQNSVSLKKTFDDVFSAINMGDCVLFVDSINIAFDIDVKGFKQRSIEAPTNEVVISGSRESFVENLRTNTSLIRKIINNENLVIEHVNVGKITKTSVAICYLKNLANPDLVSEVNFRITSLDIDSLISSGQLEQLIQDSPKSLFPQILATERSDKAANLLLEGRVVVIVNGSPYVLIMPGVFTDFVASPEDLNLKHYFSNLERIIRLLAIVLSLLLPGVYISITNYHQELIPIELLFTIAAARESVPFPTFIEILLMEISFELIREAGIRVPTPLGSTIGIVGALILGQAAVSASIVSPVLIIIIAITGICSFSIPNFSLDFTFRIYRFIYIILGYLAGFLGIGFGLFVQLLLMCKLQSFGAPYLVPYMLNKSKRSISSYFVSPMWKREYTSKFLHAQKKYSQGKISMTWRKK